MMKLTTKKGKYTGRMIKIGTEIFKSNI